MIHGLLFHSICQASLHHGPKRTPAPQEGFFPVGQSLSEQRPGQRPLSWSTKLPLRTHLISTTPARLHPPVAGAPQSLWQAHPPRCTSSLATTAPGWSPSPLFSVFSPSPSRPHLWLKHSSALTHEPRTLPKPTHTTPLYSSCWRSQRHPKLRVPQTPNPT